MSSITVFLKEYLSIQQTFQAVTDKADLQLQIFDWLGVQPEFQVLECDLGIAVGLLLTFIGTSNQETPKSPYAPTPDGLISESFALPERGNVNRHQSIKGSIESGTEAAHIVSFEVMKKLAETSGLDFDLDQGLKTLYGKLMGHEVNLVIESKAYNQNDRKLDAEIKTCLDHYGKIGTSNEFQEATKKLSSGAKTRVENLCKVFEKLFIPVTRSEFKKDKDVKTKEFLNFLEQSLHRLKKLC
jgi:hypothetical protein